MKQNNRLRWECIANWYLRTSRLFVWRLCARRRGRANKEERRLWYARGRNSVCLSMVESGSVRIVLQLFILSQWALRNSQAYTGQTREGRNHEHSNTSVPGDGGAFCWNTLKLRITYKRPTLSLRARENDTSAWKSTIRQKYWRLKCKYSKGRRKLKPFW